MGFKLKIRLQLSTFVRREKRVRRINCFTRRDTGVWDAKLRKRIRSFVVVKEKFKEEEITKGYKF